MLTPMHKALAQELLNERLLTETDTVVVGVSGGADSTALLHLLLDLNLRLGWQLKLHAAHLNHRLRGAAAEQDAAFVQAAADHLALPCTIEIRDIAQLAEQQGGGIEEVAREERYAFFERVCTQIGAAVVAVGHHADDNTETILHRILRGTGLRGLRGIHRARPLRPASPIRVIRPLLRFPRRLLLQYLADAGIAFREDETNRSTEAMRNRIRHLVLPLIEEQINPQARDALLRLAEQAGWHEDFLQETVRRILDSLILVHTDQRLILSVPGLARRSRIVQTELVRQFYTAFGLGEQNLSFHHIVSVLDLIADPTSGRQAQLPGGLLVEKRYDQLILALPSEEPREVGAPEIELRVPGQTHLPLHELDLHCAIEPPPPGGIPRPVPGTFETEAYLDFAALQPPLVLRSRRPGDRFWPLGAPGSKKVSDFLIDAKVEPQERERVLLLCDHFGPVWVIGYRIDERAKVTGQTQQVLHLRAHRLPTDSRPLSPRGERAG
ncbi:MAG TPA: tRNA lysidine(34) synthetase TilS [Phycisphaerae bacterium]|nr:tRNA lysidine(34) synthetase TilS [Phycisphaerae bacterium]HNU44162.1 tRNA lysidine(34) synthetase TilS [Phycisphaerae bacterium]